MQIPMKKKQTNESNNHSNDHEKRCVNMLIPPPLLLLLMGLFAFVFHWIRWGNFNISLIRLCIGGIILFLGCLLIYLSGKYFLKLQTPIRPDRTHTTTIVMRGPYAISRNPMYVGMAIILVGLSILLKSPIFLIAAIIFIVILHFGVVHREERYLLQLHPDEYRTYMKKVRRWL